MLQNIFATLAVAGGGGGQQWRVSGPRRDSPDMARCWGPLEAALMSLGSAPSSHPPDTELPALSQQS